MNIDANNQNNINESANNSQEIINNQAVSTIDNNVGSNAVVGGSVKATAGSSKIILVVVVSLLVVGGIIVGLNLMNKNNNTEVKPSNEEVKEKGTTSNSKKGFHVLDYDYDSLKDGGDGSNVKIVRNSMTRSKFYDPEDLPDEFFKDNPDIVDEINTAEYEDVNSRFLYPFASDYEHYYIYNLDNKSSVLEAFNKGWYALGNFYLDNMDVEFSFFDGIAVFDASITGLGKPECVIKSQYEAFPGELEEGASGVGAFVIYKLKSYYLFLDYNEYINSKEHNMDLMDAYLVFSPEMVQAMIKDNANSNSLDRYTQEYIYKNRCSFELKK